jgi:hypothetical protein
MNMEIHTTNSSIAVTGLSHDETLTLLTTAADLFRARREMERRRAAHTVCNAAVRYGSFGIAGLIEPLTEHAPPTPALRALYEMGKAHLVSGAMPEPPLTPDPRQRESA